MKTRHAVAAAAAIACGAAHGAAADLDWLAGHWCGTNRGTYNEEAWLAPRGGSLVGMHRDTRDGALRGFEFFRIVEDGAGLVYWAQPGGIAPVPFRATSATASAVDFVNAAHDFPKRVSYRRTGPRTLVARIDDGSDTGRHVEWTWTLDCDAQR